MTITLRIIVTVAAFAVTFALAPWVRRLGWKLGLVDTPGTRKIHRTVIARSGGIAVAAAVIVGTAIGCFAAKSDLSDETFSMLGAIFVLCMAAFVTGIIDDISPQRAIVRMAGQALGAAAMLALAMPLIGEYAKNSGLPFTAVAVTAGFALIAGINAVNLIDGVDGLAVGMAGLCSVGLMFVLPREAAPFALAPAILGAAAGFLPFNLRRPRMFLGDNGSMFLGAAVSGLVLYTVMTREGAGNEPGSDFMLFVGLMGLPLIDEGVCIVRRLLVFKAPSRADQSHIHHLAILLDSTKGNPQLRCLIRLIALQALIIAAAVAAMQPDFHQARRWIVGGAATVALAFYARTGLLSAAYVRLGRVLHREEKAVREKGTTDAIDQMRGFEALLKQGGFTYAIVMRDGQMVCDILKAPRAGSCVRYPMPLLGTGHDTYLEIGIRGGRFVCHAALAALVAPMLPRFQACVAVTQPSLAGPGGDDRGHDKENTGKISR